MFPELPYVTVKAGLCRVRLFQCRYRACQCPPEHRAFYRKVFLQQPWGEPKLYPGLIKPVGLMAATYPEIRGKGVPALFPTCGPAPSSGGCCFSAAASVIHSLRV